MLNAGYLVVQLESRTLFVVRDEILRSCKIARQYRIATGRLLREIALAKPRQ
jgi:hypothetical protein